MRYIINPQKAGLCLFACLVFLFLFFLLLPEGKLLLSVICLLLCILYAYFTCRFLIYLEIDEKGVRNRFLGRTYHDIPWDEIREVGIANMKILNNRQKKKVGELYLYFSKDTMTEEERLGMCLHWPPDDIRYMRYSVSRLKAVQKYWHTPPTLVWLAEEAYLDRYFRQ